MSQRYHHIKQPPLSFESGPETCYDCAGGNGGGGKREPRNAIKITTELEEVMKRVTDLKNVAGMVVVNSEGK
jgi:hypothetical protein